MVACNDLFLKYFDIHGRFVPLYDSQLCKILFDHSNIKGKHIVLITTQIIRFYKILLKWL